MNLAHGSAPPVDAVALGGGVTIGVTLGVGVTVGVTVGGAETLGVGVSLETVDPLDAGGGVDGVHWTSDPASTPPSTSINVLRIVALFIGCFIRGFYPSDDGRVELERRGAFGCGGAFTGA